MIKIMTIVMLLGASSFGRISDEDKIAVRADRKKNEPWIVSSRYGQDRCVTDDPLGPCVPQLLIINNPLKRAVVVTLGCGFDLEKPEFIIPAKRKIEAEVTSDFPGNISCFIDSWKFVR